MARRSATLTSCFRWSAASHKAEATVNYYNHQLVGVGSNADLFTAIHLAAEKLEKQCLKARTKWRDAKRMPHKVGARS